MNDLLISMYHYTRDLKNSRYPEIKGLDVELFRKQIEYMSNKYHFVSMEQVIDACRNNVILPDNALLLTFDDGYIDNYTVAMPILEEYGAKGAFFIPAKHLISHELLDVNKIHYVLASVKDSVELIDDIKNKMDFYRGKEFDYPSNEELWNTYATAERYDNEAIIFAKRMLQTALPEKVRKLIVNDLFAKYIDVSEEVLAREIYMNEDHIKALKRHGMYVGIHGLNHYWLGDLSREEMQKEIDSSLDIMSDYVDMNSWVINYPYGSYNDDVIQYARSKGAVVGLTTDVGVARIGRDNAMTLPRFDCNDFPPKSENYLNYL